MLTLRLVLRAVRWRLGAAITVFTVGFIGVVAAGVGPIYLHAVDQTLLSSRLLDAPSTHLDVHIVQETTIGLADFDWHSATHRLASRAADGALFASPVFSEDATIQWSAPSVTDSDLVAIDDLCSHVRVVSGVCLARDSGDGALVTRRIAAAHHLVVGDRIVTVSPGSGTRLPIRVVGIVDPIKPHGAFWSPWPYFITTSIDLGSDPPRTDAFFVGRSFLDAQLGSVEQTESANLTLRRDQVSLGDLSRLRSELRRVQAAAAVIQAPAQTSRPVVDSDLGPVVATLQNEMSLARTLIVLSAAQLAVLAIVLLYQAVASASAAAEPEIALGRLRGRRTGSVVLQALGPSVLLIATAVPVAAVAAWGIIRLVAPHIMGSAAVVGFPLSAVYVIVVAAAASAAASVAASRRAVLAPVGQLLRRSTTTSGGSTGLLLLDAVAVVLGVAGVLEIVTTRRLGTGSVNPLSAVAVVALAAAVAVLMVRALPVLVRPLLRWTTGSSRTGPYLALRQIARRPAGSRVIVPLAIAVALASFSIAVWASATRDRTERALEQAGAQTVYYVRERPDVFDLRAAVDRADPGDDSMAAAVVQVARTTPVLAVDTTRFDGVAAWTRSNSPTPLTTALSRLRAVPASVVVDKPAVRLTVDITQSPAFASPSLTIATTGSDHLVDTLDTGPLRAGVNVVTRALTCHLPCRITGLTLHATPTAHHTLGDATIAATLHASSASSTTAASWQPVDGFGTASRWQQNLSSGTFSLRSDRGGLAIRTRYDSVNSDWPGAASADDPNVIPAVVAPVTASLYDATTVHAIAAFGLDDSPLTFNGRTHAVSLPMLDRNGVMIDFGVALNAMQSNALPQTQLLVFANRHAPGDLPRRLARQGVTVTHTVRAATFGYQLDHSGPAYADALFLIAAILGAALAVAAAVLAAATSARRRAYEFMALRTVGLGAPTLRRAIALEQTVLLVAGVIVGLAAGLIGARLALPKTPVFADQDVGPPLDTHVPVLAPALLAIAVLLALTLTAVLTAAGVSRQASADRLGEST